MENRLKQLRKSKNLLQLKVAIELNISQEALSSYENGTRSPDPGMLVSLANYYNTSIDYILYRTDYDVPINEIKPKNLSDDVFNPINKVSKLSFSDKKYAEKFIDFLNNESEKK